MSTFALDTNSSSADIVGAVNYAIANLGQATSASLANVLIANITTGEVTTTSSNSGGYTDTTVVSYLYEYMDVKYANSATGGSGFSSNCTLANYYGLRNTTNTTISNNPTDYVWYQVTGGFGTTKSLWYQTIGGRQVAFFAGNAAPLPSYIPVPDNTALDLDTITSAQNNQIVNVNAYYQGNTTPATPSGGTYDFTTFTLTPPTLWSATIPTFVANTSVYISQAAFVGNSNATSAPPSTNWTVPSVYTSPFNGNTGAQGERGFVPLGFVITPTDPTGASNSTLSSWFSASRSNASPPIGLGYTPIAGDTAQFFWSNIYNQADNVTLVEAFDGNTWAPVVGNVVSGGLIVPGTITANTIAANQIFVVDLQSTNASMGNVSSPGYWLQANTGNARFGGNVSIGANLNVQGLITFGNLDSNTVGPGQIIANSITGNLIAANTIQGSSIVAGSITATELAANVLTVGNIVSFGANIEVPSGTGYWLDYTNGNVYFGGNTQIGNNLNVGNNATIGNNLTIGGLLTNGSLVPNVVATTNLIQGAVNQTVTAVDNTGSNLLNYTEGSIPFPQPYSYWPTGTRGVAITANLTPQSNTSTIIVNFSTYINSTANSASNCVELWRSGNSNVALNVYNAISTIWPTSNVTANVSNTPVMMAVGTQGQGIVSYDGGQSWTTAVTNAGTSIFTGLVGATGNLSLPTAANVVALYTRANTSTYYSGNLALSNAGQFTSNLYSFGTAAWNWTCGQLVQSQFNQQPAIIGGSYQLGGNFGAIAPINAITGNVISPGNPPLSYTVWADNPVNSVTTDVLPRSSIWNTAANATTVVTTVTCGGNGEVRNGNVTFNSGYNLAPSATVGGSSQYTLQSFPTNVPRTTFTSVASNATGTARANLYVAVGSSYYSANVGHPQDYGIWYTNSSTTMARATSNWTPDNSSWTGIAYGNGWWVACGNTGLIAISNTPTSTGSPGWTVLANTYAYQQNRTLTSVAYNAYADKFVITGNSIVMTATPGSLGSWTVSNVGSRATGLTRLAYYGSWYDPGRTDIPLSTQQLINGSIVSGTAIDTVPHTTTSPITYYLVAGNMTGLRANANGFIYISNPTITVTEQKR